MVRSLLAVYCLLVSNLSLNFLWVDGSPTQGCNDNDKTQEHPAVTNFRDYLRINTAHPDPDYDTSIQWLSQQAQEIGLDFHKVDFDPPNLFAIVMTWNGTNPGLKSVLINSHMDVVAVVQDAWDCDPFAACKDSRGNIFGRGAVDMKSATVGVLEAIRGLKSTGFVPLRTIHVSVLPDEEVGGREGMAPFVNSTYFANLNVGIDIDECTPNPGDEIFVAYGEKSIWQFNFTVRGDAGHASTIPEITTGQKIQVVIDRLMEFRASQLEQLDNPEITIANVTSVNLVRLGGGFGNNIIPDELWASFDMRIALKPGWNYTDVENMLDDIVLEAGPNVTLNYIGQSLESGTTVVDDSNIWWLQLQRTCRELNVSCVPYFLNGATDGKYVRNVGIPVFGLNPFLHTARMGHEVNEHINEQQFLDGIDRYASFIKSFSSVLGVK